MTIYCDKCGTAMLVSPYKKGAYRHQVGSGMTWAACPKCDMEQLEMATDGKVDPRPMRLHLGCGNRRLPGYLQVDIRPGSCVDLIADVRDLKGQLDDGVADLIYCSCLFEHFRRPEVPGVLAEWKRLLVPGGILRLSVPDFKALAKLYVEESVTLWRIIGPVCGRQDEEWNTHYCVFDKEYLSWVLTEAGYFHIREWSPFDVSKLPEDYDDYSKAMINNRLITLNLEATAP